MSENNEEIVESKVEIFPIKMSAELKRKLAALALLTGKSYSEVVDSISEGVAKQIEEHVAKELLGVVMQEAGVEFVKQESSQEPEEDTYEHSLSGDEDTGAPSLQEQVEAEFPQQQQLPTKKAPMKKGFAQAMSQDQEFMINTQFQDAGDDAEAFLEGMIPQAMQQQAAGRARSATKSNGGRRARVSEYGGDDNGGAPDLFHM